MLSLSRTPSPKELLRYSVLFCVIAWGISAIAVVSHPGSMTVWYWRTRQLAPDMFIGFLSLGFLYAEYSCVERYFQRELEASLGYIEAFGCLAAIVWVLLAYVFALTTGSNQPAPANLSANAIFYMLVFGEAMFIANIFWSYVRQEQARPVHAPVKSASIPPPRSAAIATPVIQIKHGHKPRTFSLRFESPAVVFASGAAFFLVMGTIFALVGPLVTRMPVFWKGQLVFVPAGYLWMPLAMPFAVFAAVYWAVAYFTPRQFTRSATRIHFVCTALVVLECARVYFSWASTVGNSSYYRVHIGPESFVGAFALLLVAIVTLVWNVYSDSGRSRPIASLPNGRRLK